MAHVTGQRIRNNIPWCRPLRWPAAVQPLWGGAAVAWLCLTGLGALQDQAYARVLVAAVEGDVVR